MRLISVFFIIVFFLVHYYYESAAGCQRRSHTAGGFDALCRSSRSLICRVYCIHRVYLVHLGLSKSSQSYRSFQPARCAGVANLNDERTGIAAFFYEFIMNITHHKP